MSLPPSPTHTAAPDESVGGRFRVLSGWLMRCEGARWFGLRTTHDRAELPHDAHHVAGVVVHGVDLGDSARLRGGFDADFLSTGRLTSRPRVRGTTQKLQKRSQPSITVTKARPGVGEVNSG